MNSISIGTFSGQPLSFGTVFTAFGVVIMGFNMSLALFLVEMFTSKYGYRGCKRTMNVYNYRIAGQEHPQEIGVTIGKKGQLPILNNPWK